jgi:hypothetical protein
LSEGLGLTGDGARNFMTPMLPQPDPKAKASEGRRPTKDWPYMAGLSADLALKQRRPRTPQDVSAAGSKTYGRERRPWTE